MTAVTTPDRTVLRLRPEGTDRLEALLAGRGDHLVEVVDVGTAANGDLLVSLPAAAARLTDLAVAPGGLTAGEAVTVLVPLAQALQRLHESGVAHGGIGTDAVVLDADGSPAWSAPVAPVLLRRAGPARFTEQAGADVAAFRELCGSLLRPLALPVPVGDEPEVLARGLYGLAAAEPVRLLRARDPESLLGPPLRTPSRLVPAAGAAATAPRLEALRRLLAGPAAAARTVRPRAWIALGAATALLVVALVALPSGDDGAPAAAHATRSTRSVSSARATRIASTRATRTASARADVAPRGLGGRAAVVALLAERERCLAAGSETCLRRVDAAGSPVLDADVDAVRAGTDAVRVDRSRLRTPAGGGGTALATSDRASVLAVREQNGWRLRDVVAEPPAG